jgi:hypothetical protein
VSATDPREGWTADDAERNLLARERFGMHFGLDRMHRLLNVLELPRVSFPTIHVVGTNGKSSTTRMIAALLGREGLRAGCFTSPHLLSYRERIRLDDRDIAPERFAAVVARVMRAAELVDRTASPAGDSVTQFEMLTAAALCEFESAGVDVAVLEAGLGGRFDATNVVDSRVAVLTNVGLEHTRYLGPTVRHIAREKRGRRSWWARGSTPMRSSSPATLRPSAARRSSSPRRSSASRCAPVAATSGATSPRRWPPCARSWAARATREGSPRWRRSSSCPAAFRCSTARR